MTRANAIGEIEPLIQMCRKGNLSEIQTWVHQGNPIAWPLKEAKSGARRNPLRVAMENGFYSVVEVLLDAGAPLQEGSFNALDYAVNLRRPDFVGLLFRCGAKAEDISMRFVFDMWNEDVFNLFMENGANLDDNLPVAWALIHKMRPALGVLKRYAESIPSLMSQANLALRHHAYRGSAKWVSLLLWAGADPMARGPDEVDDVYEDPDEGLNAVQCAVLGDNVDILAVKGFLPSPDVQPLLTLASTPKALSFLLENGHAPSQTLDRGTAVINSALHNMAIVFDSNKRHNYDSDRAREYLRMVHMLVAEGGKWLPPDKATISSVRRALLKMAPGYTLEFIWLMQRYGAARRNDVQELIRSPAMARLISAESEVAAQLLAQVPAEVP